MDVDIKKKDNTVFYPFILLVDRIGYYDTSIWFELTPFKNPKKESFEFFFTKLLIWETSFDCLWFFRSVCLQYYIPQRCSILEIKKVNNCRCSVLLQVWCKVKAKSKLRKKNRCENTSGLFAPHYDVERSIFSSIWCL